MTFTQNFLFQIRLYVIWSGEFLIVTKLCEIFELRKLTSLRKWQNRLENIAVIYRGVSREKNITVILSRGFWG